MAISTLSGSLGEPATWKIKHFANISGSEEFLMQLALELPQLVDASMIDGSERDKLKESIFAISVYGLMPAFEHLKKIRASASQVIPELNRRQAYEDFTIAVWRSYKDLMQRTAKLLEPEFGFLFQKDSNFEAGLERWAEKRPGIMQAVGPYLRKKRADWQNELADFRNYLEHKGEAEPAAYERHYEPAHAEMIFVDVWRTVADILVMLVSFHLPPNVSLVEIPRAERDPVRPRRFRFALRGIHMPETNW